MGVAFTASTLELLALLQFPGLGAASAVRVARGIRQAPGYQSPLWWAGQGWISSQALHFLLAPDGWSLALAAAERCLAVAQAAGQQVIGFWDPDYPPALRELPDAPPVLFVQGNLPRDFGVAVVGTRRPSPLGQRFAATAVQLLAGQGWVVVSGLALGIDTVAHQEALRQGARTVAVLGSGLDCIYPPANRALARAILARGGALMSELPPGTAPTPANLVRRNRIQAGLSRAVLLCESSSHGGAMHTARAALRYGRLLLCYLPEAAGNRPSFSGCRELVASGQAAAVSVAAQAGPLSTCRGREEPSTMPPPGSPSGQPKHLPGNREVHEETSPINQRGDKRSRDHGRVNLQPVQDQGQDGRNH